MLRSLRASIAGARTPKNEIASQNLTAEQFGSANSSQLDWNSQAKLFPLIPLAALWNKATHHSLANRGPNRRHKIT